MIYLGPRLSDLAQQRPDGRLHWPNALFGIQDYKIFLEVLSVGRWYATYVYRHHQRQLKKNSANEGVIVGS